MVVVINNNNRPIIIREIKKQIPCDGKFYTLPDDIAKLYKEHLLIVPPSVVLYIENLHKQIDIEKKKLDEERVIFEEEKKIYEPLFNKLNIPNVENESQWRVKVKRQTKYPKIDVLYSFHFDNDKDNAIKRLRASIKSIQKQNVRVCVCVTSKECIKKEIKDLGKISYYHKPLDIDIYCKPKTINLGVEKLIKNPYFIISDIDLIYPETFISEMNKYTIYFTPVRVIFNNYNLGKEYEGENYNSYKMFFNNHGDTSRTRFGIAPGNGLIHLDSFKKINGYDEMFVGYGLEDADFNLRVSYICKMIVLDDEKINTCHLYHDGTFVTNSKMAEIFKFNQTYHQNKRKDLLCKIGSPEKNIFNEKKHLNLIKANI